MAGKEKAKISPMIIEKIPVGPFQANCYILAGEKTGECAIIDPGDEPEKILAAIEKENLKPKFILITHSHSDHTGALEEVKKFSSCEVENLKEREMLKVGEIELKALEIPGHKEDSVCFILEKEKIIFTGDTLFYHGIGRTDLEGGDFNQIQKSLKRLMEFPDDFKVYPGHGPETTIGEERRSNPFLN